MKKIHGLVGTYKNKGIFAFLFDSEKGKFLEAHPYRELCETKYISYYQKDFVSTYKGKTNGIVLLRDGKEYYAGDEEHVACYVVQDKNYIYSTNYHDGTMMRYRKENDKLTLQHTIHIQKKAGTHQVLLCDHEVLLTHCLLDKMTIYNRESLEFLGEVTFPQGSGPRHGCMDKQQEFVYIISELSCDIFCVDLKKRKIMRVLNLVSDDIKKAAAAIRMSCDERFLYVSIRDVDKLFVVDIEQWKVIQEIDSGGKHPREINISPDDAYVFALNKDSDNITAFQRHKDSGKLTLCDRLGSIPEGVALAFI